MPIIKPNLVKVKDDLVSKNFTLINTFIDTIIDQNILDNLILEGLVFPSAGVYRIEHNLGREPVGFFIVKKDCQTDLWQVLDPEISDPNNQLETVYLPVQVTNACTISLFVF